MTDTQQQVILRMGGRKYNIDFMEKDREVGPDS
jgi:hypothetical protein